MTQLGYGSPCFTRASISDSLTSAVLARLVLYELVQVPDIGVSSGVRRSPTYSQAWPQRRFEKEAARMAYSFTVQLVEVHCTRTESIHSSDKFALSGAVVTKEGSTGVVLPLIRINNGETRDLTMWSYRIDSAEPVVGITLRAMDLDQNDSWPETKEKAVAVSGLISSALTAVPGWGTTVAGVISVATPVITKTIDTLISWDKDDVLFDYIEQFDFAGIGSVSASPDTHVRDVHKSFPTESSDYTIILKISCTSPGVSFGTGGPPSDPAASFRSINDAIFKEGLGYVAAYPTFLPPGPHGSDIYSSGVCFTREQAEWRDVPLAELEHAALNDFSLRMRASNSYASSRGYLGAFPTYHHAEHADGIVCGTVLISRETADWRDVPLAELRGAKLEDVESRFRATHQYAVEHGWVSGFPNMFHADQAGTIVCGSIFIKYGKGTLRDVFHAFGPR